MKRRKKLSSLSAIASEIAEKLSLTHHGHLAFKYLVHDGLCVMLGLLVEPSRFTSDEFCVHYFYQPLYIPVPIIVLGLGDRIGWWEKKDLAAALPEIESCYRQLPCRSITMILDSIDMHKLRYFGSSCHRQEFFAYSYLATGRYDKARTCLRQVVAFENEENAPEWYKEHIDRAKELLDLADRKNGRKSKSGSWTGRARQWPH